MNSKIHRRLWCTAAVAMAVFVVAMFVWHSYTRLPKRFAAVVDGQLYRSGAVTPEQLQLLAHDYGIRRVICLLDSQAAQTQAEQSAAAELGIEWHNVPLTGDGASDPEDRRNILALLGDSGDRPTLVHCAAGASRTGLAIGLYRLHYQGWELEAVLEEMRAFGFKDKPHHENLRRALATEAANANAVRILPKQTTP